MIADIEPATYLALELHTRAVSLRPFEVARRGLSLSLVTPATLAQRIAGVRQETQRRTAKAEGAFSEVYSRSHGHGASA